MALERSAISWMDRLAGKQDYILPDWGVATAPISEIGGSLLPSYKRNEWSVVWDK